MAEMAALLITVSKKSNTMPDIMKYQLIPADFFVVLLIKSLLSHLHLQLL
jgi:hypothetical protein